MEFRDTILLTEKDLSIRLRRSLSSLRQDRAKNIGIPWVKIGRSVRYRLTDLTDYLQKHTIKTTIE